MSTRQEQLAQAHADLASGRLEAAQSCFEKCHRLNPKDADALNGLGLCAEAFQDPVTAESFYRQAIALDPGQAEFYNNLGILLQSQQRWPEALACLNQSQKLWPHPTTQYNLSVLYSHLGQYWEALQLTLALIRQRPESDLLQIQCRNLMSYFRHENDLLTRLRDALAPHLFDGIWDLLQGTYYELRGESQAAIQFYRAALRSNPRFFEAQKGLISQLQHEGQYAQALNVARHMHELRAQQDSLAEFIGSLHEPIAPSYQAMLQMRQELELVVDQALADPLQAGPVTFRQHPHNLNFYHFYQGFDDKPLQIKLAQLFERLYAFNAPPCLPKQHPVPRLGIVSMHFHNHSVMHLLERALCHLLASKAFTSCIFYLHSPPLNRRDDTTDKLEAMADYFVLLPNNQEQARQLIQKFEPDLLIYPDLGMDSFTYLLALNRLAPCQIVLPGHPVTTGMPSMDYFISSEALEVPEADQYYSEQLIRLPGLPDYEAPQITAPASRESLGLPPDGNLYFCPMTLFKAHPHFDEVLQAILERDPQARILFLSYKKGLHLHLKVRLQNKLPAAMHTRLHFVSWSDKSCFYQRLQACDVILDTFYFGGGNTAYQAFGLNCPIVTLSVPWNKGRWTQAMYRLMEIQGLVAESPEEYVQLAVRLATDKAWQTTLRQEIAARKTVLFDNSTWSEALLNFCLKQASKMQIAPAKQGQ